MSYHNENFGIMDEAYFVPRTELLTWINSLLHLNLTKIQQLGSGAVYCQLLDVVHPGKVALSKINWKARNDYQFISNLKILQNAFDKIGIKKHIEVERLSKAKYQDNLELIQWMKRYFDVNCGQRGNNYLPQQRRGNIVIDFSFAQKNVVPKTYNGSGVQSQVFDKKTIGTRVKSPQIKKTQFKKTSPVHRTPISKNPASNKKIVKKQQIKDSGVNTSSTLQKQESTKQTVNLEQLQQKYQPLVSQIETELQANQQQLMKQKEKVKHWEMKMEMMRQILKGEDDNALKLSLLQEIISQ